MNGIGFRHAVGSIPALLQHAVSVGLASSFRTDAHMGFTPEGLEAVPSEMLFGTGIYALDRNRVNAVQLLSAYPMGVARRPYFETAS